MKYRKNKSGIWLKDKLVDQSGMFPGMLPAWGGAPTAPPMTGLTAWWLTPIGGLNDGDNLTQWIDTINSLELETYGVAPTYKTTSVTINGVPVAYSASGNTGLVSDTINSNWTPVNSMTSGSAYIVGHGLYDDSYKFGNNQGLWKLSEGGTTPGTYLPLYATQPGDCVEDGLTTVQRNYTNRVQSFGNPFIYGIMSEANNYKARLNGVQIFSTGTNTYNAINGNMYLMTNHTSGGDYRFYGSIAEVLIYDHVLDAGEIADLEAYLANRYAITIPYAVPAAPLSDSLYLWLDVNQETGYSNNDSISTLNDWSGNNLDFSGTGTYKTGVINSKPGVLFDGVADYFGSTSLDMDAWSGATLFVVGKCANDSAAAASKSGCWTFNQNGGSNSHFPWTNGVIYSRAFNTVQNYTCDNNPDLTTGWIWSLQSAASRYHPRINRHAMQYPYGFNQEVNTYEANNSGDNSYIGKSQIGAGTAYFFDGHICEVLIYSRCLTDGERSQVEEYLYGKYNI